MCSDNASIDFFRDEQPYITQSVPSLDVRWSKESWRKELALTVENIAFFSFKYLSNMIISKCLDSC